MVRSTTQRLVPSPEPCGLFGPGDLRLDAAAAQLAPTRAGVVGAVAVEPTRAATRAAPPAAHRRDGVEQRDHLGDVVAVAAGEQHREWRPAPTGDQMVLGACSRAVDRARAGLGAPPKARTWELSIAARDQSIRSASLSFAKSSTCSRPHTPACCHSRKSSPAGHPRAATHLLRQVLPGDPRLQYEQDPGEHLAIVDPLTPGKPVPPRTFGISGSNNSHSSSDTSGLAICAPSSQSKWTQPTSPPTTGSLLYERRSKRAVAACHICGTKMVWRV